MIVTELYDGQGLGNQLWCYAALRCCAKDLGFDFGVMTTEKFKGKEFLDLDFGKSVTGGSGPEGGPPSSLPDGIEHYFTEKKIDHPTAKILISKLDPNFYKISDNTKIDGNFQSIDYVKNHKEDLKKWIRIKEEKNITDFSNPSICVIHIRGGDFLGSSAYLDSNYYHNAVSKMKEINPEMKFVVVTDDVLYSKRIFPDYEIVGGSSLGESDQFKASHHLGGPIWMDWSILLNSRNTIISASSFSWWPTWLNDDSNVIAPKYWGDFKRSNGYWSCGDSLIPGWNYLDRDGNFFSYDECLDEKINFELKNSHFWH
jgi:hypothetical protein